MTASAGAAAIGTTVTYTAAIAELTSITWDLGAPEDIDITNHDSGANAAYYEEYVPGIIRSFTCQIEGNLKGSDAGQAAIISNLQARTSQTLIVTSTSVGAPTFTGTAYVKSFKCSAPYNGKTSFTAEFKGSGKFTFAA
jgi:hypothetical protein